MNKTIKTVIISLVVVFIFTMVGCGRSESAQEKTQSKAGAEQESGQSNKDQGQNNGQAKKDQPRTADREATPQTDDASLQLAIDGESVTVTWEDNESVRALKQLAKEQPLTVDMSQYGGFEQVGSIGESLPRSDERITTSAGDIVLYSGDQIVMFYGSNTWEYTRLGKIENRTEDELKDLLSADGVTLTLQ